MTLLRDSGYVLKITGTLSDSEEDRELKACIAENHLEDQVVFTGFLHGDALSDLIDGAACVVCPAIWYENMPNTVLEAYAQACGGHPSGKPDRAGGGRQNRLPVCPEGLERAGGEALGICSG